MKLELYNAYKTRSGHKAVVVDYRSADHFGELDFPYTVWLESGVEYYTPNGKYRMSEEDHYLDLVSEWTEPRKGEFWVNVFGKDEYPHTVTYLRKEDADKFANAYPDRIALKRVVWTEGDEE